MDKLYIIYVKTEVNDTFPLPMISTTDCLKLIGSNNTYIGYAYTTSNRVVEEFKRLRNMDKFIIRKHECDECEINTFENQYESLKLSIRKLVCGPKDEKCSLLLTRFEYDYIDDPSIIDQDIFESVMSDYVLLDNIYIIALDRLFYCNNHIIHNDDVTEDEYLVADNLLSYGLTVESAMSGSTPRFFGTNQLGILIGQFGKLFNI